MTARQLTDPGAALRLVAIGDSNPEGQHDPHPDGGFVGWVDRLAAHLARDGREVLYANLAVGGRTATQIRAEQLDRAVTLRPDLAPVVAGVNDMLRPRFSARRLARELDVIHGTLAAAGARVLCFTMPDMTAVAPMAMAIRPRLRALNDATRAAAQRHGSLLVDLHTEPVSTHPGLWHSDRLHASAEGHRRIAAAMAEALDDPVGTWREPPGPVVQMPRAAVIAGELRWLGSHLTPWLVGHLRSRVGGRPPDRSPADPLVGKRPSLTPVGEDTGSISISHPQVPPPEWPYQEAGATLPNPHTGL